MKREDRRRGGSWRKRRQLEEERRLEEQRQLEEEGRQEDESNLLSEQMKTALELLQPQPDKEKCPPMGCKITSKSRNVTWIACDRCDQWYHVKCVGLTVASKKAKSLPRWNCGLC